MDRRRGILQLPDELLLGILQRLPQKQLMLSLPRVCKAFAHLLRLPGPCWASLTPHHIFSWDCMIEGSVFCEWLQPRAAEMSTFFFPVDACLLRNYAQFTQELLTVLPESLTTLRLQTLFSDANYKRLTKDEDRTTAFPQLQLGFQKLQDPTPHLSALTSLSKLQTLALPLHTPLDVLDLANLGALKSLQTLHLEWRDPVQNSSLQAIPLAPALMPNVNVSVLSALTELSMHGSRVRHLHGLSALPHLQRLGVRHATKLELAGALGATALTSLTLAHLTLADPYSSMLSVLHSMVQLRSITFSTLEPAEEDSMLNLTSLLELSDLRSLNISRCTDLDWSGHVESSRMSALLTRLHLAIPDLLDDPEIPALSQLSCLVELHLEFAVQEDETYIIPSSLSSLLCLKMLAIQSDCSYNDQLEQSIDVTAIASLGPAIQDIWLCGNLELVAKSSLIALAEQPNLQHVWLAAGSKCNASSDGKSWLYCAALFHALATRPSRGLSVVRVIPNLACF